MRALMINQANCSWLMLSEVEALPPALWFVVVGALVLALVVMQLANQGPSKVLVAWHRYSLTLLVVLPAALGGSVLAWLRWPLGRELVIVGWALVALWAVWSPTKPLWRMVLRARWVSVARSCGLANTNDRRGSNWPFDVTVTITNERVEYLPIIKRPKTVPGGVLYTLIPARGSTINQVAEQEEALAAGLKVSRVMVERTSPSRGLITFLW